MQDNGRTQRGPTPSNGPRSQDTQDRLLQASGEGSLRPSRRIFDNQLTQLSLPSWVTDPKCRNGPSRNIRLISELTGAAWQERRGRLPSRPLPRSGAQKYRVTDTQYLTATCTDARPARTTVVGDAESINTNRRYPRFALKAVEISPHNVGFKIQHQA